MTFDARLLDGLSVLVTIVERGNFVRAALALGLTTSGVSRAVTRLEARLGARLFQRTSRGVQLTEEGHRLHAEVAPLLSKLGDATNRASTATVRGLLRVNTDAPLGDKLAAHLPALLALHPELEVEMTVRTRLVDAEASGFDVAVRFGPPERSSLTCRKLFETRVLTCAAPSYVAARGRPEHPRDLVHHDCMRYRDPATGKIFEWELRRGDETFAFEPRGRLVLDDPSAALRASIAGYGVFQPLDGIVHPYLERGELVQLLPDWSDERWPAYAYYRGRAQTQARVRAFLEFVVELTRPQASSPPPSIVSAVPVTKPLRKRKR